MATIKFSEFDAGNINVAGAQLVGLTGGNSATNARFTASDLVNGLATVTYVDTQDAGLQSQITLNTNAILEIANNEANIATLQGQVGVLEGKVVVLEGNIVTLENSVTINSDDIIILQGNIVAIENEVANINTDSQTLTYDGANANLSISNGNSVVLQEVLDNAGNITVIQGQISDLQANGNIQTLSLDNSSNVLSISGGNTVDFTDVLGNVAGSGSGTDTFGTTISIANTSTDVYNRNGVLPADAKGMAVSDPNGKSGWYWISPGPTANPTGLNSFQWKMFNNDGPQTFTVADIDYIYMIVDLYTVGQIYFNVYTAGINPAPTAYQSRFGFTLNGDFASTGRFLMWAKPPGSTITVDDVEVYPFLERLELPYDAAASTGTLLTSEVLKSVNVQTRANPALTAGEVEFNLKAVGYKVNDSYIQNFDMEIYGGDQSLSLDDSSNVLTISGSAGDNTVDFTTVLGNVAGGGGGGGNPFDQNLNTTDSPTFDNLSTTGELDVNGSGTHTFEGTLQFTQLSNFGGLVGITSLLDEDDMASNSATALATQQSIKAYVDANAGGGGSSYGNANVTAYAEAGWAGNIIPSANVTYDLGTTTNRWKDLYLSNATIYIGDQTISVNNEGTLAFSGNISAQNIIDETSLIIHGGVVNTTQVGTTDGLEWQAIDLPGHSPAFGTTEMATNGSDILAAGQNGQIAYSLDHGETWELLNPRIDLGFEFSMSSVRIHYISSLDTFFIGGNQGHYFTTQDFVSFSGELRANPGGWNGILGIADNGTNLVVISGSRVVHYIPLADLSNEAGWTSLVNNLSSNSGYITYNGTRFVIIEYGSNAQSSTDGVTWVNKTATGLQYMRGIAHDETGKIVAVGGDNKFAVSTDDGVTWTVTDISSQVEWGATMKLSDVAYGDGLWVVSGYASPDIQYVSEDLVTWSKIQTNAIGPRDINFMSYAGDTFYGQNQDGNYKLDWPVGKQLLLFNGNVVATRSDISYAVASAKLSSAEHVSTAWLTITPDHDGSNANANVSNVEHSEIVFNSATTSLDITSNAQPVARITSGVLVQVHGSWDASAAGAFDWATDEIASHGISNVTRDSAGIYTVTFETPFASDRYTATFGVGSTNYSGSGASPREVSLLSRTANNCQVICERSDDAVNEDNFYMSLMICGIVATQ